MSFASYSRQAKNQDLCVLIRNGTPNKALETLPARRGDLKHHLVRPAAAGRGYGASAKDKRQRWQRQERSRKQHVQGIAADFSA